MSTNLKNELYETLRRCALKAGAVADKIGVGESHLRKATTPDIGVNFPLEWLVPFMNVTKDYRALRYLNRLCGFVEYPIPVKGLKKGLLATAELQKTEADLIVMLHLFYDNLNKDQKAIIDATGLVRTIEKNIIALAAIRADVMKRAYGQMNLFDGEDSE